MQIVNAGDRLAREANEQISLAYPSTICRRPFHHIQDQGQPFNACSPDFHPAFTCC